MIAASPDMSTPSTSVAPAAPAAALTRRTAFFLATPGLFAAACAGTPRDQADEASAIRAVLAAQAAAWNCGDVEGFMQGYWKNDALRFATGGEVTRGWSATLARYQHRYATRAAMGALTFSELEIQLLAPDAALVFGHWQVARDGGSPHGLFTLAFRKFSGRWVIVADHTSAA